MEFIKKVIRKIKDGMLQEMYEETKWMYTYAKKYKFQIVFYIAERFINDMVDKLAGNNDFWRLSEEFPIFYFAAAA